VQVLSQAFEESDEREFVRVAHAIKGASANFGAVSMARLATEIEKSGMLGANTEQLIAALRSEFNVVRQQLELEILGRTRRSLLPPP
jgi:HPt (histidine-containing phosphotransfer) domain-containing protein